MPALWTLRLMQEMGGVREGADLVDVASSVAFGMGCIGLILLCAFVLRQRFVIDKSRKSVVASCTSGPSCLLEASLTPLPLPQRDPRISGSRFQHFRSSTPAPCLGVGVQSCKRTKQDNLIEQFS